MDDQRKRRRPLQSDQGHLWDAMVVPPRTQPLKIKASSGSCAGQSVRRTVEPSARKAETGGNKPYLSQAKFKGGGNKYTRESAAFFAELVEVLPAILLLERMKVVALKETKKVIKPLKPKAGIGISTSMGIKRLGSDLGLTAKQTARALEVLVRTGCVKSRKNEMSELGNFILDPRGRVVPSWHCDLRNPERLARLLDAEKIC